MLLTKTSIAEEGGEVNIETVMGTGKSRRYLCVGSRETME